MNEQIPMPSDDPGPTPAELEAMMQAELADRLIPGEELPDKLMSWAEATSESYANHFRLALDEDPSIVDRYRDNPEETLQELEEKLSHH